MAKIDLEVFTNEIEKTYTILKQNLIMIDTIKQLIAQGNLSEDAIVTLKTSIERANAMISGLEGAIDNTNTTIENMNKVMPTDINSDNNGCLILEHDGVEITGQKKLVKIGKYNSATSKFEFTDSVLIPYDFEIDALNNFFILAKDNLRVLILSVDSFTKDADIVSFTVLYKGAVEKTISLTIPSQGDDNYVLTNTNIKTIFGNQSLVGTGNIDLYKHRLTITPQGQGTFTGEIYSSSNTNVSSNNGATQKLTTLLKCTSGYYGTFLGSLNDQGRLIYNNKVLQFETNTGVFTISNIVDVVEPI